MRALWNRVLALCRSILATLYHDCMQLQAEVRWNQHLTCMSVIFCYACSVEPGLGTVQVDSGHFVLWTHAATGWSTLEVTCDMHVSHLLQCMHCGTGSWHCAGRSWPLCIMTACSHSPEYAELTCQMHVSGFLQCMQWLHDPWNCCMHCATTKVC